MEVVYTRTPHPLVDAGRKFQNPRFWNGPLDGVTKVFVDPDFSDKDKQIDARTIARAYEAKGVKVVMIGEHTEADLKPLAAAKPKPEGA